MNKIALIKLRDNIQDQMRKKKMTQTELALRMGVSEATVSRYMHLKRTPTLSHLGALAIALGCNVSDLLDGIRKVEMV